MRIGQRNEPHIAFPIKQIGKPVGMIARIDYDIAFKARYSIRFLHMTGTLPDRLSVNAKSPHYDEKLLERGVGVRFNGVEKTNVEEYCVSEGWITVVAGKTVDRKGNPMTIKLKGTVEPYLKDVT